MRQLKFRAWDKKKKKWLGPNLHMAVIDGMLYWQFGYGCEILSAEERENIELMEYTGLKDENVIEIYSGDILRFDNYPEALDAEVVWFKDAFRVKELSHEADIEEYLSEVNEVSKIIGNLYENPELKGPVPSEEDVRAEMGEDEVADKRDANKQEEEFYNDFHQTGGGGERQ